MLQTTAARAGECIKVLGGSNSLCRHYDVIKVTIKAIPRGR
jgi:hypothetical protein